MKDTNRIDFDRPVQPVQYGHPLEHDVYRINQKLLEYVGRLRNAADQVEFYATDADRQKLMFPEERIYRSLAEIEGQLAQLVRDLGSEMWQYIRSERHWREYQGAEVDPALENTTTQDM